MANSHKPKSLVLVEGSIKRGDTIEAWPFKLASIPEPENAVVVFSAHLETLASDPVIRLSSADDEIPLAVEDGVLVGGVERDGVLVGEVPAINAPAVGTILWELQVRVPTVPVAAPEDGEWTRTVFSGKIVVEQDGADRTLP